MKGEKVSKFFNEMMQSANRKSPAILTGLSIAGLIATVVFSYRAGMKAPDILERKRKDMKDIRPGDKEAKKAITKEAVKELTPVFLPPILMGAVTTGCIIGSNTVSTKRIAVLSAAYKISESTVKDLNGKMTEVLGERKAREIKDKIVKDKLDQDPVRETTPIILTGDGDVLCKDLYSGRFFRSNGMKIGQVINEISSRCFQENYVRLNDLYYLLHLDSVPMGEDFGWTSDDLVGGHTLPITISAQLTEDQQPCLCIDYEVRLMEGWL